MKKVRLFTALRFNEQTIEEIAEVQELFKAQYPDGKYPRIENFHITLYFIGNVDENQVPDLESALRKACDNYKEKINRAIELEFNRVGTFRGGQIVWLGIKENDDLKQLADMIREEVEKVGIPVDKKPFRPHITLGRKFKGDLPRPEQYPKSVEIDKAALVYSHRVDDVLTYTNLIFEDLTK